MKKELKNIGLAIGVSVAILIGGATPIHAQTVPVDSTELRLQLTEQINSLLVQLTTLLAQNNADLQNKIEAQTTLLSAKIASSTPVFGAVSGAQGQCPGGLTPQEMLEAQVKYINDNFESDASVLAACKASTTALRNRASNAALDLACIRRGY